MKSIKHPGADQLGTLLFLGAAIFSVWFRLLPPFIAGFPINDGGLFYKMIEALQTNGYRLPEYVPYNGLQIPFAYPPLAFYIAGFLSPLFSGSILETLRWLPAITLIAVPTSVYFLAGLITKSRFHAGLAAFLYVLLPRSITWLIMGGGITRSLGQLFLILASAHIYLLYTRNEKKHLIASIVLSSLVCVTHPEAALHTVVAALLLLIFYGRTKTGAVNSILLVTGTMILTAPWWLTMIIRFGPAPFLSATQTGLNGSNYLIMLIAPFAGESFLTIISVFAVLGVAGKLAKGEYFLPLWYVIPFFIEPRNAPNVSIIPMAILASAALADIVFPSLARFEGVLRGVEFSGPFQSRTERLLFLYLAISLLLGMQYFELNLQGSRVSAPARESFEWIKSSTAPAAHFLILTGKTDLFKDFTNEWFPVLTDRVSLTTIQGLEWVGVNQFSGRVPLLQKIQQCPNDAPALPCMELLAAQTNSSFDYIYVAREMTSAFWADSLILELNKNKAFSPVYSTDEVVIFERMK